MKSKMVLLGVLMVCSLLLASFAMDAGAQGKKVVIGASMVQKDSDWWAMMAKLAEQAAKAKRRGARIGRSARIDGCA